MSKKYALVQHTSLIDALTAAVRSADMEPADLACSLTMSESGTRMRMPKGTPPHARELGNPTRVPGADAPSDNAYAILQALAWVAARRKEVAEQTAWRAQIPELMDQLLEA